MKTKYRAMQIVAPGVLEMTVRALRFSQLFQTLPVIEQLPFDRANEALDRLKMGQVRYRIVLTMNQDN